MQRQKSYPRGASHAGFAVRTRALHGCSGWAAMAVVGLAVAAPKVVPPELPAETLTTRATLAPNETQRVYVADVAISHIVDGRLRVFDAATGRLLGMVNTGFAGNFTVNPAQKSIYVATTYNSRGGRGERADVVEVWDTESLALRHEIALPPKRAQTLNYRSLVSHSNDGRWLWVQNATPATSVTVVDLNARQAVEEIQTPGCWGAWPSDQVAGRFATLCGDGKIATINLDSAGKVAERKLSEVLFDADHDAWFNTGEQRGNTTWFVSFQGVLHAVSLGGEQAQTRARVPLVGAGERKAGWRPGGYQPLAVDPSGEYALVAMHRAGSEGSHKRPADALWLVATANGKKLASWPGRGTIAVTFAPKAARVQALDGMTGALNVWSWHPEALRSGQYQKALKFVRQIPKAGESAVQLEAYD